MTKKFFLTLLSFSLQRLSEWCLGGFSPKWCYGGSILPACYSEYPTNFSEKPSGSNDRPYVSKDAIKGQKSRKHHSWIPHIIIPYNQGLRIFSEKLSCSNDGLYCLLHSWKTLGRALVEKRPKSQKHLFWMRHLNPNPGLRIFSEKLSCSNNKPYCILHSCKKLGRSLQPL